MIHKRNKKKQLQQQQQKFEQGLDDETKDIEIQGEILSPSSSRLHQLRLSSKAITKSECKQKQFPVNIQHPQLISNLQHSFYVPLLNNANNSYYHNSGNQLNLIGNTTPSNNNIHAIIPSNHYFPISQPTNSFQGLSYINRTGPNIGIGSSINQLYFPGTTGVTQFPIQPSASFIASSPRKMSLRPPLRSDTAHLHPYSQSSSNINFSKGYKKYSS